MVLPMLYTDDMERAQQIDPQALQNLLGNALDKTSVSPAGLIPESLMNLLTTVLFVSLGFMAAFLILYGLSVARKWKVQSAILHMQKDVTEIKQALVAPNTPASVMPPRNEKPRKVEVASAE